MPMAHPMQDSFNAGEWSHKMYGQVSLDKYRFACRTLENFIPLPQGPAESRPGFRYVATAKHADKVCILRPFELMDGTSFVLEFGEYYIRFYTDQEQVMVTDGSTTPLEIVTPYTEANLRTIQIVRSYDVAYLLHPDHPPYKLTHLALRSWTFAAAVWNDGPYLNERPSDQITLTSSGTTGTVTITASDDVFDADHVGTTWRIRHSGASVLTEFSIVTEGSPLSIVGTFVVDISVTTDWVGRIVLQKSVDYGSTYFDVASFSTSTKQQFNESKLGIYYRLACVSYSAGTGNATLYEMEHNGLFTIDTFNSETEVTATVIQLIGSTDPTPFWREPSWSPVRGYPRTGAFRDGRLWLANSYHQPMCAWATWVGDIQNYCPGSTEDAPVTVNMLEFDKPIQWLQSLGVFFAGTSGEEAKISTRKAEPISPTNPPAVDVQTTHGTASQTFPVKIGSSILFVQAGRRKVRAINYQFANDAFQAEDLTVLADHITESGVIEIAYQKEPNSVLWCVRDDGQLAGLTYFPDHKVMAWFRVTVTGMTVESVASILSDLGDSESRNELWASIYYTPGSPFEHGTPGRHICLLADHEEASEPTDYVCLDLSIRTSISSGVVSGLDHLEAQTVTVMDGFRYLGAYEVESGQITITEETDATTVLVGIPYTCVLETMDFEAGAADGTSQARAKQIHKVTIRVLNTLMGKIGPDADNMIDISNWIADVVEADVAPDLREEDIETDGWPDATEKKAIVRIEQQMPLPVSVLAIYPVMTTSD